MRGTGTGLVVALALAGAVWAEQDQVHPLVAERIAVMQDLEIATLAMGEIAREEVPYDRLQAEEARLALMRLAAAVPDTFETEVTGKNGNALPVIWLEWDRFVDINTGMVIAAQKLDVTSPATLREGMEVFEKTCVTCHEAYVAGK